MSLKNLMAHSCDLARRTPGLDIHANLPGGLRIDIKQTATRIAAIRQSTEVKKESLVRSTSNAELTIGISRRAPVEPGIVEWHVVIDSLPGYVKKPDGWDRRAYKGRNFIIGRAEIEPLMEELT